MRIRRPRGRLLATPVALGLVALMALPMAALATTTAAIAQTGGMTVLLPGLGTPITVDVQLDASGNVSQVNLDPVGTYSASKLSGHAVTFDSADGTTQVKIRAGGSRLSVKAAAGTLDALVGSGTWSADVFGTGTKTTVGYTVGKAADGSPTVSIDSVNAPSGITVAQGTPKTGTEDHEAKASATVAFSLNGFTKKLTISVSVDTEDAHQAVLNVTLSGKDRQQLPLADLIGAHTWSGKLCDGTAVGFSYTVNDGGALTYGSATGATATSTSVGHGLIVRFDGTKARVMVLLTPARDGTTWALSTRAQLGRCSTPAPLPTVNAPVLPGADQPSNHQGDHSGDWSGSTDSKSGSSDSKSGSSDYGSNSDSGGTSRDGGSH